MLCGRLVTCSCTLLLEIAALRTEASAAARASRSILLTARLMQLTRSTSHIGLDREWTHSAAAQSSTTKRKARPQRRGRMRRFWRAWTQTLRLLSRLLRCQVCADKLGCHGALPARLPTLYSLKPIGQ